MKTEDFSGLESPESMLEAQREDDVELTDEKLEAVSGGIEKDWSGKRTCPSCSSTKVVVRKDDGYNRYQCLACGNSWRESAVNDGPQVDGIPMPSRP